MSVSSDPWLASPPVPVLQMNSQDYRRWRDQRLQMAVNETGRSVEIDNPFLPGPNERAAIMRQVACRNFSIYHFDTDQYPERLAVKAFSRQLGLQSAIPSLESGGAYTSIISNRKRESSNSPRYIPYTSEPLKWHTDGYYNSLQNQVRSFIIHCESAPLSGGENQLMDHEIAYILLRETGVELVQSLCDPKAITIPANIQNHKELRKEFVGPVFSTDPLNGKLYMRYTQRARNIIWKKDDLTKSALKVLDGILAGKSQYITGIQLKPGQGIICNNILHCRAAFEDGDTPEQMRSLVRIRFRDRIDYTSRSGNTTSRMVL